MSLTPKGLETRLINKLMLTLLQLIGLNKGWLNNKSLKSKIEVRQHIVNIIRKINSLNKYLKDNVNPLLVDNYKQQTSINE